MLFLHSSPFRHDWCLDRVLIPILMTKGEDAKLREQIFFIEIIFPFLSPLHSSYFI